MGSALGTLFTDPSKQALEKPATPTSESPWYGPSSWNTGYNAGSGELPRLTGNYLARMYSFLSGNEANRAADATFLRQALGGQQNFDRYINAYSDGGQYYVPVMAQLAGMTAAQRAALQSQYKTPQDWMNANLDHTPVPGSWGELFDPITASGTYAPPTSIFGSTPSPGGTPTSTPAGGTPPPTGSVPLQPPTAPTTPAAPTAPTTTPPPSVSPGGTVGGTPTATPAAPIAPQVAPLPKPSISPIAMVGHASPLNFAQIPGGVRNTPAILGGLTNIPGVSSTNGIATARPPAQSGTPAVPGAPNAPVAGLANALAGVPRAQSSLQTNGFTSPGTELAGGGPAVARGLRMAPAKY